VSRWNKLDSKRPGAIHNSGRETWTTKIRMREIRVRPSPVPRRTRWGARSQALSPVVPWGPQSLEPCSAQSLVPQLAQRKSGREEPSLHLVPKGDGLRQPRREALLLRSAARRKEKRQLRSLRVRVEALRPNRDGSQRASEVRRLYARHLSSR